MGLLNLLLVNVPADLGKKAFDLAFPFQRRLNFGLLSLATMAKRSGLSVQLLDPQVDPGRDAKALVLEAVRASPPQMVGISCTSGFSYPSALAFAQAIREALPEVPIVIGGKDHVGQLGETVLDECDAIDAVVRGEAENLIVPLYRALTTHRPLDQIPNLVWRESASRYRSTPVEKNGTGLRQELDYSLLPDFRRFAPSIEVSRGCSFTCEFCVSARTEIRRVPAQVLVDEIERLMAIFDDDQLKLYFETPIFLMHDTEITELAAERRRRGLAFTWRTETRVDYLSPERLRQLAAAGLRVIDLGFESGCAEILLRMGKTRRPEQYLAKTREVLSAARELGILVKLNLLLYVGETASTMSRTLAFLAESMPNVEALSAYPLMLYPGTRLEQSLSSELDRAGGSLPADPVWSARHLSPINLSARLPYQEAARIGLKFAQAFQTMEAFYRQKTYGYFSPGTTYDEFTAAAQHYGLSNLPFSLSAAECAATRTDLTAQLAAAG